MLDQTWLIVVLGALGNALLGLTTYLKNPKSDTSRWFALFSSLFAVYLVINQFAVVQTNDQSSIFWIRMVMAIAPPIVFSFFMLVRVFPKVKADVSNAILIVSLAITVFMSLLDLTPLIFAGVVPGTYQPTPGKLVFLFPIYNVVFLVWSFYVLFRKFREASGKEKIQLKIFVLGAVVMFSLILLTNVFLVIVLNVVAFVALVPIYTLVFVGSVAYAIIKHRMMDINILIARTVSYTIIIFLAIVGYVGLLYAFTLFIPELGVTTKQLVVFSTLSLVLFFTGGVVRRVIQELTDKVFFKGRYDSEKLLSELTHIMASELDIRLLSSKLLSTINDQMRIVNSAFVVINGEGKQVEIEEDHGKLHFQITNEELVKLTEASKLLVFEDISEGIQKMIMRKHDISIFVSLMAKETQVGYLLMGPKASGDIYSNQDAEVLEIFASQAAVALQNALRYLEIQEFSRTLEKKVEERTSELKESQERELTKARELLKIKDEFVFIATHDLRTPVTAIDGYISLIKEDKPQFSPAIEKNFAAVEEASGRLKQLVNDLLEVARGESGTIKVDVSKLDINELIDQVVREVKPAADEKHVQLQVSLDQTNTMVMGDTEKLAEVVENLMSNAVKFSKAQGASIAVSTKRDGNMLVVSVADNGYGIPKEEQAKVFQKFFKYRGDETQSVPGTGLGLFVVRMLVEKMGGRIGFVSEAGRGTTFSFSIPIAG